MLRPLASLIVLFLACAPVLAEDWREFRGPSGQGLVRGDGPFPLRWSPTQNVTWKQDIPGSGWSSPVVVGDRVYLTSAVEAENQKDPLSLRTLCLDANTGKILWNVECFTEARNAPRIHSKNSHASPTPLVEGDGNNARIYVHFGHMGTACLNKDGKLLWKTRIAYSPVHGNGGSPVLVDGVLFFSCDGARDPFVIALDAKDGKQRWKTARSSKPAKTFSFSTPLVIDVDGKKQILSPGSDMLGSYDPSTGKEIWRVHYTGYSVIPRPVFGHGLIFLSTSYDRAKLLAIKPGGTGDVTDTNIAWTMDKGAPHTPSPLLVGDELYTVADNGLASCVDAKTGKVHWQKRVPGTYSASPVLAAGRIYLQNEDGIGVVLKAGKEFEELARNPLGERTLASYAVVGKALLVRTASRLYRFEEK
jgi:outer membrane protein assembly factor BamB